MNTKKRYKTERSDENILICDTLSRRQKLKISTHSLGQQNNLEHVNNFQYNKWYINPKLRMKKSIIDTKKQLSEDYLYNKLYQEHSINKNIPYKLTTNEKVKMIEDLSSNDIGLLFDFKNKIEKDKKRVPKIIEFIVRKKKVVDK